MSRTTGRRPSSVHSQTAAHQPARGQHRGLLVSLGAEGHPAAVVRDPVGDPHRGAGAGTDRHHDLGERWVGPGGIEDAGDAGREVDRPGPLAPGAGRPAAAGPGRSGKPSGRSTPTERPTRVRPLAPRSPRIDRASRAAWSPPRAALATAPKCRAMTRARPRRHRGCPSWRRCLTRRPVSMPTGHAGGAQAVGGAGVDPRVLEVPLQLPKRFRAGLLALAAGSSPGAGRSSGAASA